VDRGGKRESCGNGVIGGKLEGELGHRGRLGKAELKGLGGTSITCL